MLFSFFCTLFRQYDDCEKRNKHTCRYVKNRRREAESAGIPEICELTKKDGGVLAINNKMTTKRDVLLDSLHSCLYI